MNQLILCPFDARRLAGGKGKLPRKFSRFVLFRLIDKRSFNLSCILDLFAERWQSTLFQMFLLFFTLCMPDHCFTQHLRGKGSRCLPDTLCMPDTLQPLFKHCACLILYSRCYTQCMPDHCFIQHLRGKDSRCYTLCMPDHFFIQHLSGKDSRCYTQCIPDHCFIQHLRGKDGRSLHTVHACFTHHMREKRVIPELKKYYRKKSSRNQSHFFFFFFFFFFVFFVVFFFFSLLCFLLLLFSFLLASFLIIVVCCRTPEGKLEKRAVLFTFHAAALAVEYSERLSRVLFTTKSPFMDLSWTLAVDRFSLKGSSLFWACFVK